MNNEIKEILDKINNVVNHKEASYNALVETKAEDYKQLLDYITNLQQENQRLKENNQGMQEEMARVWEKNERLKAIEILHNLNDTLPLDLILSEIEHSENILQNGSE